MLNIPVIGTIPYVPLELVDEDTLIDYEKKDVIKKNKATKRWKEN